MFINKLYTIQQLDLQLSHRLIKRVTKELTSTRVQWNSIDQNVR